MFVWSYLRVLRQPQAMAGACMPGMGMCGSTMPCMQGATQGKVLGKFWAAISEWKQLRLGTTMLLFSSEVSGHVTATELGVSIAYLVAEQDVGRAPCCSTRFSKCSDYMSPVFSRMSWWKPD